jgi:hypothetical protein
MSQTTGNQITRNEPYDELSKLKQKVDTLLQPTPTFNPFDVVKWKKGLKNKKYPEEEQLAMVIQELEEPILQSERDSGTGVLNINTFLGLFFTLFLFHEGGMVGKRAASIWVYIEFIAARLPTLQIRCEKKVIPYLKFNTPLWNPILS